MSREKLYAFKKSLLIRVGTSFEETWKIKWQREKIIPVMVPVTLPIMLSVLYINFGWKSIENFYQISFCTCYEILERVK